VASVAHCIGHALIRARKVVRGLSLTLIKDERQGVAQRAVMSFAGMRVVGS